jgi:two-component system nitrate/nitrite response regulator NarL
MTTIAIVGSSQLFREALARMLGECGYDVVDVGADAGDSAPDGAARHDVDVVLTETPAGGRPMGEWLQRVGSRFPGARIILLTGKGENGQALLDALAHGVHGYLQNSLSFETVRSVVDAVSHGQMVYPSELRHLLSRMGGQSGPTVNGSAVNGLANGAQTHGPGPNGGLRPAPVNGTTAHSPPPRLARPASPGTGGRADPDLSFRERQILGELAQGHSNKVIAFRLALSEATVKSHLKSLLRKLGYTNRTQAAIFALKHPDMVVRTGMQPPGAQSGA